MQPRVQGLSYLVALRLLAVTVWVLPLILLVWSILLALIHQVQEEEVVLVVLKDVILSIMTIMIEGKYMQLCVYMYVFICVSIEVEEEEVEREGIDEMMMTENVQGIYQTDLEKEMKRGHLQVVQQMTSMTKVLTKRSPLMNMEMADQ